MIKTVALSIEEINKIYNFSQRFRGKQIFKNIYAGYRSFSEMSDLPKQLRDELTSNSVIMTSKIITKRESIDGTKKIAIQLEDGNIVESVLLITDKGRKTACISTQVGCAMGCKFCCTALNGIKRNLTAGEIVEQFMHLRDNFGEIYNIVFMGMGEPLNNFDNLKKSISILTDADGYNLSKRHINVSTCGVVPGIEKIVDENLDIKLAISLNAAIDEKRDFIMPVNKTYNLKKLQSALIDYCNKLDKRVTLEYVLIKNFNDSSADIKAIKEFVKPLNYLLNIIPWNKVETIDFESPSANEISFFHHKIEESRINATIRRSRGQEIDGACGQLAGKLKTSI